MSVEVHQYLDNSGGSNFTEQAPRPPVGPGEENELHSTGGHSNKSSGSHKSLTSNRSNGSGTGGATPRRSQKSAKVPPTTAAPGVVIAPSAVTISSTPDATTESDAPLGFEPEGSVDAQHEFFENNSPAYVKWAENLDFLLEDADGVTLFKNYLTEKSSVNLFEFYFAWKYLQDVEVVDTKGMSSLVKTMYKVYIKGLKGDKRLTLVSDETRQSITSLISAKQYSKTIFDAVKDQVVEVLKRDFYLPFLKSNIYLQYIQTAEESPKESANSSGSGSARPMSTVLPTVPEHSELDFGRVSTTTENTAPDAPVLTLTAKNMKMTERLRQESKIKPEEQAGYYLQKEGPIPPHPYHTYNTSYLPISAIDSERQSLSSEALTDDTHSITDSSLDGYPQYTSRVSARRYYRKIKTSAQRNPEAHTLSANNIVPPRNNRLSKVSNIAETSPMEFAELLTDKLQRVLAEQMDRERVRCKLNAMSEDDATTDDSHSMLSSTTGGAGTANTTLNQLLHAIQKTGDHDDAEAQDILDMHCKRIWERSGQHTPAKSPSRAKSPEHLQQSSLHQHNTQQIAKRMHTLSRGLAVSSGHAVPPAAYSKHSSIIPSTKPLSSGANPASSTGLQYQMDGSYPVATSVTSSQLYNKSNSRHGLATFSSRAEQQSIFKPPIGVAPNNQKVAEWISRNEEILQHSSIHGPPESDKSSFKRSQRSGSTSASPRAIRSKAHGKSVAMSVDTKRITQEDKHSSKSKSTTSSSKDRRSMSRSAGETPSSMLGGNSGQLQQTLTQRKGVREPPTIKVAFFLLDEPIPYSVTVPGTEITLAKFKEQITKKGGNYRYFFKKATGDEFGRDVPYVLEEITDDNQILPKWEAKVVGHVKKVE